MKATLALIAALVAGATSSSSQETTDSAHLKMLELLARVAADPEGLAEELASSPMAAIVPDDDTFEFPAWHKKGDGPELPTVLAHGMGDSCFNRGMKTIAKEVGAHMDSYSVCVPTGDSRIMDTINGFLLDMDSSVDVFAEKIKADENLAGGFNAIGFSQGNSLIRGYIQKYNDPPVNTFLSVHGTVSGTSGFPNCDPAGEHGSICAAMAEFCGAAAYNSFVQGHLFQADYFRDPEKVDGDAYKTYSQLARWNNEAAAAAGERGNSTDVRDASINANFGKVHKWAMIKAEGDSMIFPNEGEWWGKFDGAFDKVIPMRETDWYLNDSFGLRTADEAGKIFFNSTEGDHLQFSTEQLLGWIDQYF